MWHGGQSQALQNVQETVYSRHFLQSLLMLKEVAPPAFYKVVELMIQQRKLQEQ